MVIFIVSQVSNSAQGSIISIWCRSSLCTYFSNIQYRALNLNIFREPQLNWNDKQEGNDLPEPSSNYEH